METNIVLIGFMGAGKTEVGRLLAKNSGLNFIDTDFLIESCEGIDISEIFAQKGEDYFRGIESKILRDIRKNKDDILNVVTRYIDTAPDSKSLIISERSKPWIISTGGGMPVFNDNMKILKDIGFIIYLKADGKTIYGRVQNERHRPVLGKGGFSEKEIEDKLGEREKFYGKANMTIYTEGLTVSGVSGEIGIFLWNKIKN